MMTDFGRLEYEKLTEKRALFIAGLILILVALVGVAVTLGSADLPVADSYLAILAGLFPGVVDLPDRMVESNAVGIVWGWRLHRVLFAIVAGFGLAIAGTVMQGVLRNPLASPFTLGIASAASCGASIAIILGAGFLSGYLVIGNAFLFAMLAAGAIYGMARLKGLGSETMILAGIALMYLFSAITSFLQYLGTSEKVQEVVFWMFGSLDKSSWPKLAIVAVVVAAVVPPLLWRAWDLNALAEGDEVAKSLGVPVERSMAGFMLAASLVTAVIICFTGTIGFIGLVAPHITRMAIGADYRTLIPASGLVGAVLLLGADCLARTAIAGAIIPVGIMTAFLGIPFFLYLFMRRRDV
ncbi:MULTISPECIES: iron ABC transporter permease [unclassified Methanoculleus]|jgi:iron complex transport system permease protein|uniref:FecCD family ABC transporter permease n=1 Tax=unclassified Methanoculleus TaxID=2619537 RepID=UPI0025F21083|nr:MULTISPECIES: iron ABC transporter permease [unclassified Methanoculleus]MCK9318734.1 iron ABC transporter permease [Methanoculleus sp.]MDD2255129.1 iron ABC transporter permease [Methanoculleus sp.]MDD2788468.1 iron ABC transporter permease [Methanoculleus sp.]MDD3216846.1 iron ABC transporter permease [Methanoculleus sp.]MDD4315435.1 iron ABC transporter permease [Methanoculleus sp.]